MGASERDVTSSLCIFSSSQVAYNNWANVHDAHASDMAHKLFGSLRASRKYIAPHVYTGICNLHM